MLLPTGRTATPKSAERARSHVTMARAFGRRRAAVHANGRSAIRCVPIFPQPGRSSGDQRRRCVRQCAGGHAARHDAEDVSRCGVERRARTSRRRDARHHRGTGRQRRQSRILSRSRFGSPILQSASRRCVDFLKAGRTPAALVATASVCMEVNDLDAAARDLDEAIAQAPELGRRPLRARQALAAVRRHGQGERVVPARRRPAARFRPGLGQPRRHPRRARSAAGGAGRLRARARPRSGQPAGA